MFKNIFLRFIPYHGSFIPFMENLVTDNFRTYN